MRYLIAMIVIACAAPAGAAILTGDAARVAAALPDPAAAALMFGGVGLIAGARRAGSLRGPTDVARDGADRASDDDRRR